MTAARIIVVGGGVRSGKSAFALQRAEALGVRRAFFATAQPLDDDMRTRVRSHQIERGTRYRTVECPLHLPEALSACDDCDVAVVDCLTLWLSNLLLQDLREEQALGRIDALVRVLETRRMHTVIVTNEVGMGVVPPSLLGRRFRDLAGRAHQALSAVSDELYLAALGLVIRLRPGPVALADTEWP